MVEYDDMNGDDPYEKMWRMERDASSRARKEDLPFQRTKWRLAGRGVF